MSSPDPAGARVLNFADFLEPPKPEPADPPAGEVVLEAPTREGLGAAPAPALGGDEAATVLDPAVWFREAADLDPPEPATVLVPDDVVRVAQQLAEEARAGHAPAAPAPGPAPTPRRALPPPTVEIDLDAFDDDAGDGDLFAGPVARLWNHRGRLALPVATAGSLLALAVALGAWVRTAAPAPAAAAPAVPPALARRAGRMAPPAATPVAPSVGPRAHPRRARHARLRRRERRHHHRLRAPTADRRRTDRTARDLRRGRADYDLGDLHGALSWYVRAARLSPRDPDARFGVALAAYELHHDRTAWRSLKRALRLDPGHADANLLLGFMLQEAGRDKGAAVHYARYLKAAPRGEWARDVRSTLAHLGD